jgi:hypothetical protein
MMDTSQLKTIKMRACPTYSVYTDIDNSSVFRGCSILILEDD